jgi:hypothetical protein
MSRPVGTIHVFHFGLMFAVAAISAACGGGGSGDVTGPPGGEAAVDSLVLSLDSAEVIVGDTVRLTAEARDAGGQVVPNVRLSYTSSNPAVATVSEDGLITSVDLGVAEVEVAIAGAAALRAPSLAAYASSTAASGRSRMIVVSQPKVVIRPGEQMLERGATSQYSASITNIRDLELLHRPSIRWSSSDPSIATIDSEGLATAASDGDTDIIASVTIPGYGDYRRRVPLHVVVCGGIFRVRDWLAAANVEYHTAGNVAATRSTYVVNQFSGGAATLEQVPSPTASDTMVWEGKAGGEVGLDNTLTFPVPPPLGTGVTKEVKSGPIQGEGSTAIVRLTVKKSGEGSACTYDFQWGDYFVWSVTNNQGAPPIPKAGPVGVALLLGQVLGATPADGHWKLGDLNTKIPLPARAFPDLSISHYTVGSTIGASLIIALGGASATYDEAELMYFIQGHVR